MFKLAKFSVNRIRICVREGVKITWKIIGFDPNRCLYNMLDESPYNMLERDWRFCNCKDKLDAV